MYFWKLFFREWGLIVISLLCLFGILLCYTDFSITYSVQWAGFVKATVMSIAGGFISGYFFYTFSILKDKSKKQPPILKLLCQQIRYAKDELSEMSNNICDNFDINQCVFGEYRQELKSYEINKRNKDFLLHGLRSVDILIRYPMSMVDFLDSHDVSRISKTAQLVAMLTARIIDTPTDCPIYFDEKQLDNIKEIHKMLEQTYENLKEYE